MWSRSTKFENIVEFVTFTLWNSTIFLGPTYFCGIGFVNSALANTIFPNLIFKSLILKRAYPIPLLHSYSILHCLIASSCTGLLSNPINRHHRNVPRWIGHKFLVNVISVIDLEVRRKASCRLALNGRQI